MARAETAGKGPPTGTRGAVPTLRLGPRPLPQHLLTATLGWSSSLAMWRLWSAGSNGSRPPLPPSLAPLAPDLANADPDAFAVALERETIRRLDRLAAGIAAYRAHPYRRRVMVDPPAVWQEGTTRLLDYTAVARTARKRGEKRGSPRPAVLVVPSLINRAYILDLEPERSLMRFLAREGFAPLLIDWGAPAETERRFTLTDYIAGRIEAALDAVKARQGGAPVLLLGYCMGGLLALAAAQRRRRDLAGLVLMATPWDFHAERPEQARLLGAIGFALAPFLAEWGELPVDGLQALFAGVDPFQVIRKFLAFAELDPDSDKARQFVALEDWLNDGVPLAAPVALECLVGWYGANAPARGQWLVAGEAVEPAALDLPALVVLPDQDRIVPPKSAAALAAALPKAERLTPAAGHIGMVVGGGAEAKLWRPLGQWMSAQTSMRAPARARTRSSRISA
jgi:polyhydroxyalkanoate synthase